MVHSSVKALLKFTVPFGGCGIQRACYFS